MKLLSLILLLASAPSFACWNMKATLSVNNSEVVINQKINHDQVYSFAKDQYIFNVKIPATTKADAYTVLVDVVQKEKLTLKTVATGKMMAKFGQKVAMTKEDSENKVLTKMTITVTEI